MSDDKTNASTRKWYVASWPPLAWLETVIKLAAIVIGIAAFVQALSGATFALPRGLSLEKEIPTAPPVLKIKAEFFSVS